MINEIILNEKYSNKQLTDFLPAEEAQLKENEFVEKYKNEGWKILNKHKTGALGGFIFKNNI